MYKNILKKLGVVTMVLMMVTAFLPAASAYTYRSANGNILNDSDFSFEPEIDSWDSEGYAWFCVKRPAQYFNGYAIYAAENSFQGGLNNYKPRFMDDADNCYKYPKKFSSDGQVVAKIYPYVQLSSGAKKYIQPGYTARVYVNSGAAVNPPSDNQYTYTTKKGFTLTEDAFKGNQMKVQASQFKRKVTFHWTDPGKYFEGYAVYVVEGNGSINHANVKPKFLSKKRTSYKVPARYAVGEKVTVYIYPYIKLSNGAKKYIQNAASTSIVTSVNN